MDLISLWAFSSGNPLQLLQPHRQRVNSPAQQSQPVTAWVGKSIRVTWEGSGARQPGFKSQLGRLPPETPWARNSTSLSLGFLFPLKSGENNSSNIRALLGRLNEKTHVKHFACSKCSIHSPIPQMSDTYYVLCPVHRAVNETDQNPRTLETYN